jgi:3-oxoadipate enol-lactonase
MAEASVHPHPHERHWAPALPPGQLVDLPDGRSLFVRVAEGPPGAPTLMLMHGWGVTSDLTWFPSFEPLAAHYRVVAFDLRGHGRGARSAGRFRLEDCADDAIQVADALGIDQFVPVGYSLGGPVAMLTWRDHRDRVAGLVLCATAARFRDDNLLGLRFSLFAPLAGAVRALPEPIVRPLYYRVIWKETHDSGLAPWIIDEIRSSDPRMVASAGRSIGAFDGRDWVGDVDVPVGMVVIDGDDVVATPRQDALAALLPHARVVRIEGRHDVCVRNPRRFVPALLEATRFATSRAAADQA